MDFQDEVDKRKSEKNKGVDEIFTPHPTSYNSSGDETSDGGRPNGSTEGDNSVNEKKQEYDKNYQNSK